MQDYSARILDIITGSLLKQFHIAMKAVRFIAACIFAKMAMDTYYFHETTILNLNVDLVFNQMFGQEGVLGISLFILTYFIIQGLIIGSISFIYSYKSSRTYGLDKTLPNYNVEDKMLDQLKKDSSLTLLEKLQEKAGVSKWDELLSSYKSMLQDEKIFSESLSVFIVIMLQFGIWPFKGTPTIVTYSCLAVGIITFCFLIFVVPHIYKNLYIAISAHVNKPD